MTTALANLGLTSVLNKEENLSLVVAMVESGQYESKQVFEKIANLGDDCFMVG